jgi:hypothetical protein
MLAVLPDEVCCANWIVGGTHAAKVMQQSVWPTALLLLFGVVLLTLGSIFLRAATRMKIAHSDLRQ